MSLASETRLAVRALTRTPGVAVAAVLTLALGIGANATIFAVVWGVLLRPLDLPEPGRLVTVWEDHQTRGGPPDEWTGYSVFSDWRERNRSFAGITAYTGWFPDLTGVDRPESLAGKLVTPGYFEVLGVPMAIGRGFLPQEEAAGDDQVAVLSHGLWQRRFGGDPEILGRALILDGSAFTVVGVLPEGYREIFEEAEIWAPFSVEPGFSDRGAYYLRVIARRLPAVTAEMAAADLSRVGAEIAAEHPTHLEGVGVRLIPLHERTVGNVSRALWVLLGAVGLVLLIACANVANLLLARAAGRRREFGVRTALGAGRWRLVRQVLVESALLGLAGGGLGVLLGFWGLELFRATAPDGVPRLEELALGGPVLLFSLALSLAGSLLFGLAPALRASRAGLGAALADGGRGGVGVGRSRLRGALVVAEIALGLALLVGAGLLLRSLSSLTRVDPGFRADGLVTGTLRFPGSRIPEPEQVKGLVAAIVERLESYPGVTGVGAVSTLPLTGGQLDISFGLERRMPVAGKEPATDYRVATAGYFETMGIPLLQGRLFGPGDDAESVPVIVVSQAFVDRYLPGENPLGQRMRVGNVASADSPWWTVVGVVGGVRDNRLERPPDPEVYVPFLQRPSRGLSLVARTAGPPELIQRAIVDVAHEVDPDQAVAALDRMDRLVSVALAAPRFLTGLLVAFGLIALLLAAVGIYGVMAHAVSQRTREIGIRMALGARSADILGMVLRWGTLMVVTGLALGLAISFGLGRTLSGLLFGVGPYDVPTLAATSGVLAAVAFVASVVPARRASRVDPMSTLRSE